MVVKIIRVSIVILAEAHNPSILSPDWLKNNNVIDENPIQFVHTPDFAVFDSKNYNLIVDRQRYQLNAKRLIPDVVKSLATISEAYIDLLPHIPFLRLGLNFDWAIEQDEMNSPPEVSINIGELKNFNSIFPKHELKFGSIIYAKENSCTLRLTTEPFDENTLICKFNYEYSLKGLTIVKIKEFIAKFPVYYEISNEITKKIMNTKQRGAK